MATFTSIFIIASSIFSDRWAFRELRDIAEMKFRFAEEEDACEYVTRLASELHLFAPAHVLKVCVHCPSLQLSRCRKLQE